MEAAAIAVSLVALVVATVSLIRAREAVAKQLQLQGEVRDIQAAQLEIAKADAARKGKAAVGLSLRKYDLNSFRFYVRNAGPGKAFDVSFELQLAAGLKSPLGADYARLIPIAELPPNHEISIRASIGLGGGGRWPAKWSWRNEDGSTDTSSSVLTC